MVAVGVRVCNKGSDEKGARGEIDESAKWAKVRSGQRGDMDTGPLLQTHSLRQ